jgi:hypothetical protein
MSFGIIELDCELAVWLHDVQDEGLDIIAAGLTTLKDMAGDINEVRQSW